MPKVENHWVRGREVKHSMLYRQLWACVLRSVFIFCATQAIYVASVRLTFLIGTLEPVLA